MKRDEKGMAICFVIIFMIIMSIILICELSSCKPQNPEEIKKPKVQMQHLGYGFYDIFIEADTIKTIELIASDNIDVVDIDAGDIGCIIDPDPKENNDGIKWQKVTIWSSIPDSIRFIAEMEGKKTVIVNNDTLIKDDEPDTSSVPQIKPINIKISWDANTESDLAGYYVSIQSPTGYSKIDVGKITVYPMLNIDPGEYGFKISAYDWSGNESEYSNEIRKTFQ